MRRSVAAALFAAILGTAGSTFADPLRVTAGTHYQTWDELWSWRLLGAGFDLTGTGITTRSPVFDCPSFCDMGTTISLDTVMETDDFHDASTSARIGDTQYSEFFWAGRLEFDSGTLVGIAGTYDLPFTFSGMLAGYANPDRTGSPLFTLPPLTGAGTVRIQIIDPQFENRVEVWEVTYAFADPVPEPATMTLLGSGLVGIFAMRRRRDDAG